MNRRSLRRLKALRRGCEGDELRQPGSLATAQSSSVDGELEEPSIGTGAPPWPNGHFYSPVPALDEIRRDEQRIFAVPPALAGIDLRSDEQLALLEDFAALYADHPFPDKQSPIRRYWFSNGWFEHGDAIVLHCMLRHLRPRRVIEVGSGFSSAVLLDTNELFLDNRVQCTFIEPYPERLRGLLRETDTAVEVIERPLQAVDPELFDELGHGDLLFVDSTHVSKVGSDVNTLFFDILPRLAPGVVVHIHDIFYPFEYPPAWVFEGRAWNEAYLLRSFLQFNDAFRILWFNSYLGEFHADAVAAAMPLWAMNRGGSIWLQRRDDSRPS